MGERKRYSAVDARIPVLTKRLRQVIEKAGGVTAAAKQLGISRPTVSFWYNGERTPDASGMKAIAERFSVSVDWLLGVEGAETVGVHDVSRFLDMTGLSFGAFGELVAIRETRVQSACTDVLNLMLEQTDCLTFLGCVEAAISQLNRGGERAGYKCEESLFMATWALRRMMPEMAKAFRDRGYLTSEQRMAKLAEEGADDGKL